MEPAGDAATARTSCARAFVRVCLRRKRACARVLARMLLFMGVWACDTRGRVQACASVCTQVGAHKWEHTSVCVCMWARARVQMCACMAVCMCVCVCVCARARAFMCVHVCVCVQLCTCMTMCIGA